MKFKLRKQTPNTNERRRPTGDSSPSVFSYYARGTSNASNNTGRRDDSSDKPLARRLSYRFRAGHAPSYIAFAAIVMAVLYSCVLQPNPRIIITAVPGTVSREPKVYQQAVLGIWKRSILSRTKLTVSTGNIRHDIQGQFNELANVRIELPLLGHRPIVILTPQTPALQLISNNGAFYVDEDGKVMARVEDVRQNELKNLTVIKDETGLLAEPGKGVLTSQETIFLRKLADQLRAESLSVVSITLPGNAANEADVRLNGQRYYVKFSFDNDPRQGVGTYLAAKSKLDADHITPAEYIDVRVDEKVFYK